MTDYNPNDRADVKEAERRAKAEAAEDAEVVRGLMRTKTGRAWMYRKLAACNVHRTTFNGNALQSAFAEGMRNTGLILESEILSYSPDEFILMLKEGHERAVIADTTRANRKRAADADDEPDTSNFVDYTAPIDGEDTTVQ